MCVSQALPVSAPPVTARHGAILSVLALLLLLSVPLSRASAQDTYVRTPRDTGLPPAAMNIRQFSADTLDPEYQLIHENESLRLFFRDDRDVLAIEDLRNGYLWKTGLDIPFNRDLDDLADELLENGGDPSLLPPQEERLNTTFTGIANSLVSIEYYDAANNLKRNSSAAEDDARSVFTLLSSEPFLGRLDVVFEDIDLQLSVELSLGHEDELIISIPEESLRGEGMSLLSAVTIAPFFGASGGRQLLWDPEEEDFEISRAKSAPDGYVLIPDGSGALVRFTDNSTELSAFSGDVYGEDMSQSGLYRTFSDFSVPYKNSFMPLFGVVHGNLQNAFAAYATEGDEYLEIIAFPEENTTYYTRAYPRFVYNRLYFQVYNQRGDGYFRMLEQPNSFNARMHYRFLQGDGSDGTYRADYSGIASLYREVLLQGGILPQPAPGRSASSGASDIPLRIDFLMADVKDSVVGRTHEITTTVEQVGEIVSDLQSAGLEQLSIGLLGYARGGTVLYRPGRLEINRALGSPRQFRELFETLQGEGIDISFIRDYGYIAEEQLTPWGNAIRGASGWYNVRHIYLPDAPATRFNYARSERIVRWLESDGRSMQSYGAGSFSLDGIGHLLSSEYQDRDVTSVSQVIERYRESLADLRESYEINLYRPNQYLWSMTDRFLHIPLFSSQFLLETDTVPLLPMVLQGSMDLFGPYSNFSFSSDIDILRMIDYHVYPSFLITAESAHLLMMTNSSEYYSTQYELFRETILDVYSRVNEALSRVRNARWLSREVLSEGLVRNRYDNGIDIYINYHVSAQEHEGVLVPPLSSRIHTPSEERQ